ncbi:MAG: TfoX/Sxy family protein [Spirochaetales bacterium]|nr:TfoX/Sxy family protein [Leptospiraceae bacterium]MCP5482583.1 TfoX/Sxy family protein [Spirochaetales bacterium]MCP5485172.1 TfoX/Sxy family protein [Spirochaetales bacterium]
MAIDETLAERVREILVRKRGTEEKRMFGGLAFMVDGHMCVGIIQDELMVRVGPDAYDSAIKLKHARPMDFTGKPMKGMLYVAPAGLKTKAALGKWIDRGLAFVKTLPPK